MKKDKTKYVYRELFPFVALLLAGGITLSLTGCGNKAADDWQNETAFGTVNESAEIVNNGDVETEYEMDKYVLIDEINNTPYDMLSEQVVLQYFNRVAEQTDMPYIMAYDFELNEEFSETSVEHKHAQDGIGVYFRINSETEKLNSIYFELPFNDENDEEYYNSVSKIIGAVYGGVPGLKKFDMNKIFFEMAEAFKEGDSEYEFEFNDVMVQVRRDYGYIKLFVNYVKK